MTSKDINSILTPLYYDFANAPAFTSATAIYKHLKEHGPEKISLNKIKKWLSEQTSWQLHKRRVKKFPRRKTISKGWFNQIQIDLVDMSNIKWHNKGHTFLLTAIDVFSRRLFAIPIKNKSAIEVVRALNLLFNEIEKIVPLETVKFVQSDQGKEFLNHHVKSLLDSKKMKLFWTNSGQKCSILERAHRTLRSRMYKYFSANNTLHYLDILPAILEAYNSSRHSTIGIAPALVNKENERRIWKKQYGKNLKSMRSFRNNFKAGDKVRVVKLKHVFEKGYLPSFTKEVFRIDTALNTTPPTYYLRDDRNELLKGAFYEQELQKIP